MVVALVGSTAGAVPTAWHESRAPDGGAVYTVAIGGDGTYYAGTEVGIFVSRDGVSWRRSEVPIDDISAVTDIRATTTGLALAAVVDSEYDGRVLRTVDGGGSWRVATGFEGAEGLISDFAVDPADAQVAYALAAGVLYATTDGGSSWAAQSRVRDRDTPTADASSDDVEEEEWDDWAVTLAVDPLTPSTIYAGGYRGIFTSSDGGMSWIKTGVGLPSRARVWSLAVAATSPRTIYAGTDADGVFKSVDGGAVWRPARFGLPMERRDHASITGLALDPHRSDVVYAATTRGAATSVDGGASWRTAGGQRAPQMTSLTIEALGRTLLAGTADHGILRSDDGGETWRLANTNLTAVAPTALAVARTAPTSIYVGTWGTGLVASADGGETWTATRGAPARWITAVVVDPKVSRNVYVGSYGDGVLRSRDGGATWAAAGRALERELPQARATSRNVQALAINPMNPRVLYAASQYVFGATVARSRDGGASWRRVFETENHSDATIQALAIDPGRPSTVYAGTGEFSEDMGVDSWGVFVSRNAGATWTRVVAGLHYRDARPGIGAFAVSPRNGDVYAATRVGVFRLKRGGARWVRLALGLPTGRYGLPAMRTIVVNPRTEAVLLGTAGGLYELRRTSTSGVWVPASPRLAGLDVRALAVTADGRQAYAATPGRFFTVD